MALLSFNEYKEGKRAKDIAEVLYTANPSDVRCIALERLNNATKEELCTIKGIGPKTAQKVTEGVPYENDADFLNRSQLNEKIAHKILDWAN